MVQISVGIVGVGKVAKNYHLPAYKKIKEVRIIGIADVNLKRAKEISKLYKVDTIFSDYFDLLEKKPDIIDICVPPWLHEKIALEAMSYGSNVLVEKPMALSLSEAERMVNISSKKRLKLGVVHNYRYLPAIQKAHKYVLTGQLGHVQLIETKVGGEVPTRSSYIIDIRKSGGIIFESGIHDIDLQYWIMGDVSSVYAEEQKVIPFSNQPLDVKVLLKFRKGGFGFMHMSWLTPYHHTLEIIGTGAELFADMGSICIIRQSPIRYVTAQLRALTQPFSFEQAHYKLIRDFVNSVINDSTPPITGEEGKETIKIAEAINRSLKEQRWISL
jgi:predicted dehydrogenase